MVVTDATRKKDGRGSARGPKRSSFNAAKRNWGHGLQRQGGAATFRALLSRSMDEVRRNRSEEGGEAGACLRPIRRRNRSEEGGETPLTPLRPIGTPATSVYSSAIPAPAYPATSGTESSHATSPTSASNFAPMVSRGPSLCSLRHVSEESTLAAPVGAAKGAPAKWVGRGMGETHHWVPAHVREADYFHGMIHKDELAAILKKDGDFVIRMGRSEEAEKRITLTVLWEEKPRHFIIQWSGIRGRRRVWVEPDRSFADELKMCQWYMETGNNMGVRRCVLRWPIGQQSWELRPSQIRLERELGFGAFGRVWEATLEQSPRPPSRVAVKLCDSDLLSLMEQSVFMKEAEIGRRLVHSNIIGVWGVQHREEPLMIIMELAEGGSLLSRLRGHPVTEVEQLRWSREACGALEYLEQRRVLHRDVAARNCLLGPPPALPLKLGDFGLAKAGCTVYRLSGKGQTRMAAKWMSPEVMESGEFSLASEVWAFGVLVWEIFTRGEAPYKGIPAKQVKDRICGSEHLRLSLKESWPSKLRDLITSCWAHRPHSRPKMSRIGTDLDRLLVAAIANPTQALSPPEQPASGPPSHSANGLHSYNTASTRAAAPLPLFAPPIAPAVPVPLSAPPAIHSPIANSAPPVRPCSNLGPPPLQPSPPPPPPPPANDDPFAHNL